MESAVKNTMHNKSDINVKCVERLSFRSRNQIPRQVRAQMQRKKEASDGLKTVKSVQRCLNLWRKLLMAEEELKRMYIERKIKEEGAAIAKI